MKITTQIRTEWAITFTLFYLQRLPGFREIYRQQLSARSCMIAATIDDTERYEFYFTLYSGRCGVLRHYRRHPYTEIEHISRNHREALQLIARQMREREKK